MADAAAEPLITHERHVPSGTHDDDPGEDADVQVDEIADVLFIVGALMQALTTTVAGMIAGRSIVGAAVGSASFVVPLYISELSPSPFRGRLVVVSSLFITGGQVVAYIIGWLFSEHLGGWRWMVGLGAVPAVLQFCMLFFLPETPRYLVKAGKTAQANRVLMRVYAVGEGDQSLVNAVLRRVEREIIEEEDAAGLRGTPSSAKTGWRAKLDKVQDTFTQLVVVGGNRRALVITCMLQGFQQLCGFVSFSSNPLSLDTTSPMSQTYHTNYTHPFPFQSLKKTHTTSKLTYHHSRTH
ncbi:hypothetical protein J1614_004186 [Plenodomus biglobosus]|nr:hypothetical protein J1614_004186 [Plenodomus biglobosus]